MVGTVQYNVLLESVRCFPEVRYVLYFAVGVLFGSLHVSNGLCRRVLWCSFIFDSGVHVHASHLLIVQNGWIVFDKYNER